MSAGKPETLCMVAAIRQAGHTLMLLFDKVMANTGLRLTQYSILSELEKWESAPSPTLTELADALVMERSALGQTLRPLQRDGWSKYRQMNMINAGGRSS